MTGDGVPEAVIRTWTGIGVHSGITYYVFSLGSRPRCLLVYDKNNIDDREDFDIVDLDGDGKKEIVSWYDGFVYAWGGYGCSPRVPVVLGYSNRRYVDVTRQYPAWLKIRFEESGEMLVEARRYALSHESGIGKSCEFSVAVQYYCILRQLYSREIARRRIRELMVQYGRWTLLYDRNLLTAETRQTFPENDFPTFKEEERKIEKIMRERSGRYSYPRPYSRELMIRYEDPYSVSGPSVSAG